MAQNEPEITEIASFFAQNIPNEGHTDEAATEAWRHALRYARSTGAIDELVAKVAETNPENSELQRRCAEVKS